MNIDVASLLLLHNINTGETVRPRQHHSFEVVMQDLCLHDNISSKFTCVNAPTLHYSNIKVTVETEIMIVAGICIIIKNQT